MGSWDLGEDLKFAASPCVTGAGDVIARSCFCFGGEAMNASGEAARDLVTSRLNSFAGE